MKLDRAGIKRLISAGYSKTELCPKLDVSRPTLIRWLKGAEPRHEGVVEYVNREVAKLCARL